MPIGDDRKIGQIEPSKRLFLIVLMTDEMLRIFTRCFFFLKMRFSARNGIPMIWSRWACVMKICSIFHCPLRSRTLVRLPVSNKILSFSKKLGGRCPGNSAPEQPRTLTSMSSFSNQTISFTSWFEVFLRRTPSRISLQGASIEETPGPWPWAWPLENFGLQPAFGRFKDRVPSLFGARGLFLEIFPEFLFGLLPEFSPAAHEVSF